MPVAGKPPPLAYVAWIAICVIWGTTYLAIKIALETMPPMLVGGIRYLIAGGVLVAWLRFRGERLPPLPAWWPFVVLGFLMLLLGNGGVVWAEQYVPSGLTAVILASTPFWMVAIESLFPGGARVTMRHGAGLLVAFTGILVLIGPDVVLRGGGLSWDFLGGVVALQLACIAWSIGSSYARRLPGGVKPLTSAALQMLCGGIWLTGVATMLGEWTALSFTTRSAAAMLYLAFIGGLAGFVAYTYALAHLPMSLVALYSYVNPIIAVALGSVILGEPLDLRIALAIAIILSGMALVPTSD